MMVEESMTNEIIINPELHDWIIPLKPKEYSQLEKSILSEGCRDPIVLWNGTIVDGHHRYKICTEHNIPFKTIEKTFVDIDGAKLWMVDNQLARRNLDPIQRIDLTMKGEELVARKAKEQQLSTLKQNAVLLNLTKRLEEGSTISSTPLVGQSTLETVEPSKGGNSEKEIKFDYFGHLDPIQRVDLVIKGEEVVSVLANQQQKPINHQITPTVITPVHTRKEMAKRAGVSELTYERGKKVLTELKKSSPDIYKEVVQQGKSVDSDKFKSINFEYNKIKQKEQELIPKPSVPETIGKYRTIVIDPPWEMKKIVREVRPNQDVFDYPTMTVEEIKNIKLPVDNESHIYLWTTQKYLPFALDILKAWGARYMFTMVWHKNGGFQPIGLPQYNCEFVVFGKIGTLSFDDTKAFNTCFDADRREHSRKPDEFYNVIRRVSPPPRIDMFSREKRDGFDQWGNEVDKLTDVI